MGSASDNSAMDKLKMLEHPVAKELLGRIAAAESVEVALRDVAKEKVQEFVKKEKTYKLLSDVTGAYLQANDLRGVIYWDIATQCLLLLIGLIFAVESLVESLVKNDNDVAYVYWVILVCHSGTIFVGAKTLGVLNQFEMWANEAIHTQKPVPLLMKRLSAHKGLFKGYLLCILIAFVADCVCIAGVLAIDFDTDDDDDLGPYTVILILLGVMFCLDLVLFLWIPMAIHMIPDEHWAKLRPKLVKSMPYCDCCLPAVHKEDDDAVELLIQATTDTLVWSEATCAQAAPASDLGPAIASWSDRRRGDTVGDGSNKALVDLVSSEFGVSQWVWISTTAAAAGDVVRFSKCKFKSPDGKASATARGAGKPHYAVVLTKTISGTLELIEQAVGTSKVVSVDEVDLNELQSGGTVKVFRATGGAAGEKSPLSQGPGVN